VIAFLSDQHADPDIAVESFVLDPLPLEADADQGSHPTDGSS
jgi:hypothetical protein